MSRSSQTLPEGVPGVSFADCTAQSGGLEGAPPHGGHGVGIADDDDSGLEHVYISQCGMGVTPNLFARHRGDFRFDVSPDAGGAAMVFEEDEWSHGFAFADFDADGCYELFVSAGRGPYRLFRWEGDRFEDITADAGISGTNRGTRGIVAADLTGDGSLDLFCLNNHEWHNADAGEVPNDVFLNDGHGCFTLADARALGLADPRTVPRSPLRGLGQGVTAADFDGDGRVEIYTCIRFLPNRLWKRQTDGTWRDVAPEAGVACVDGGDGAVFADLWNRGLLDLIATGGDQPETPYLRIYRNNGDGTFEDLTQHFRIRSKAYHVTVADFNADGHLDLFVPRDYEPCALYLGDGRGGFVETRAGVEENLQDARCSAAGDLNGDGRLDLVVAHKRDFNRVYRNQLPAPNWVKVRLTGPRGDRGAFGSKLSVYRTGALGDPAALLAYRESRSTYGYVGQDSPTHYVGLGEEHSCDLRVRFPDGSDRIVRDVQAGNVIRIDASKA